MIRVVIILSLSLAACAIPLGAPPIRANLGLTKQQGATGSRIDLGTSLGSLIPAKDMPFDVGAGFLFDMLTKPDGYMDASGRGKYVDAGAVVHRWGFARLLAGARYEKYSSGTFVHATKARVDLEILGRADSSFSGADSDGGAFGGTYGNAGIGVYAEAGPAWNDDGVGWTATVGLSLRLPALGVLIWGLPKGSSGGGGHRWSLSGSGRSGSSGS